jgi:hypothetical protein
MLFIINPHSIIDLITNSSTELFVMKGSEKKHVEEIIKAIYPNYLTEYEPLLDVKDFSIEELDNFLGWCLGRNSGCWNSSVIYNDPYDYVVLSGFEFNEIYNTSKKLSKINFMLKRNVINIIFLIKYRPTTKKSNETKLTLSS